MSVKSSSRLLTRFEPLRPVGAHPVIGTLAGVLLVALLVPLLGIWHGAAGPLGQSIPLFFLVPVLLTSGVAGEWAGAIVAVVAIAAWDWFFIPPIHRASIASVRDVMALIVFLGVAGLTGRLSSTARRRTNEAVKRASISDTLYNLSVSLIARLDLPEVLNTIAEQVRVAFGLDACAVLLRDGNRQWRTAALAGDLPDSARVEMSRDVAATASYVLDDGHGRHLVHELQRRGSRAGIVLHAPSPPVQLIPLQVGTSAIGVLELVHSTGREPDAETTLLLDTMANGIALALEQERLSTEEREAELARERDTLKSSLLASVSHDLRTPLAGIKAASSSLLQDDVSWSEGDRRAFLHDIDTEADRLSRLVSNLLDLTRIEAGMLRPACEWEDVVELTWRVADRLGPRLPHHRIVLDMPPELPPVCLDTVQIEQVLENLIENAAKYSPTDTTIVVSARVVTDGGPRRLDLAVTDSGPGIPAAQRARIFEPFYRAETAGHRARGVGMGLAIVKGLVEAHGGRVWVANRSGPGSTLMISLPLGDPPDVESTRFADASGTRP